MPSDALRCEPPDDDDECPNCGGLGFVAGCFEDTCCGADCDPEDAEWCCAPMRCDWCRPVRAPALPPEPKGETDAR